MEIKEMIKMRFSFYFFCLLLFFVLVVLHFGSMVQHELAHVKINEYFGVESETYYDLVGGHTVITSDFNSVEDKRLAFEAHAINEAVAYNIQPYLVSIFGVLVLGFVYFGGKLEEARK